MQVSVADFNVAKEIEEMPIIVFGALRGTIKFHCNIIDPLDEAAWEAQK